MNAFNKRDPVLLFIGDIVFLYVSLWATLLIRYQSVPSQQSIYEHVLPFSILFVVWFLVFYIWGLYEKRTIILQNRLPNTILKAQVINSLVAVLFFYFIPYFGITPKTNLFIYLIVSFFLILGWRIYGYAALVGPKRKQNAILIAGGLEMKELNAEVNNNQNYNLSFISAINLDAIQQINFEKEIVDRVNNEDIGVIAIDFSDERIEPLLPKLYSLIFSGVIFIDMHKIYEDVFDRIPLSLIKYSWFLENISLAPKRTYDILKRIMDVFLAAGTGIISLVAYPFVIIAIKLDDGGPIFITQERVGKDGKSIFIYKFRSMSRNDTSLGAEKTDNVVTRVGDILRKTRLDELPQLWNVIRGDLSLIGPRPELPTGVAHYEKEIPYYGVRHLIKPGLSGWAQLYHDNHPHHAIGVQATKEKLSYDLFYLKNRSFILDVKIALKTIKKVLSRSGA